MRTNASPRIPLAAALSVVGGLIAFLSLLSFPNATPDTGLDASWSLALDYFFRHRMHAGTDYIFTYGPLGFLMTSYFDPYTFWWKWSFEILAKGYVIFEALRLLRLRARDSWLSLIPLAVTVITFAFSIHPGTTYVADAFGYIALVVLATAPLVDTDQSPWRTAAASLLVALLSLMKGTLLALAIPVILLWGLRREEGALSRIARTIRSPLLQFPAIWLALWFLLGQRLEDIAPYGIGSYSVAVGYARTMAVTAVTYRNTALPTLAGILALACLLAFLVLQAISTMRSGKDKPLGLLHAAFVAVVAALAWKHGITRGQDHTILFDLTVAFTAAFLAVVLPFGNTRIGRALLGIATLTAMFGALRGDDGWFHLDSQHKPIVSALRVLVAPAREEAMQHRALQQSRDRNALPNIRRIVGDAPIDMWSFQQGIVLLNGMSYRPHPSLQGYNAYTHYLQQRDIDFWESDAAPDYLLFKVEWIDRRFPTLDGGPAFVVMLARYEPIYMENGYILMRRRPVVLTGAQMAAANSAAPVADAPVGQWVDVPPTPPGTAQLLSIAIPATPQGTLRQLAYKSADAYLQVRRGEGDSGNVYRIVPDIAAEGFLLNPDFDSLPQIGALYSGRSLAPLRQIRVVLPPESAGCFAPAVRMCFYSVPFEPMRRAETPSR